MNNPSDEQLQRKIAEVQGWTELYDAGHGILAGYDPTQMERGPYPLPNWPTDRNASYELVKGVKWVGYILLPQSAHRESLLFLEHKGWRWVDCPECVDGKVNTIEIEQESVGCSKCDSEGGFFEKT